ncbi:MAG: dockerin type I domain-containing protein [Magnetococcus sp. YQC-5]
MVEIINLMFNRRNISMAILIIFLCLFMTPQDAFSAPLDVDQSGTVDATDGVLILRRLNGGSTIVTGVMLLPGIDNAKIVEMIDGLAGQSSAPLDVDQSGTVDATDGVLILRRLNGGSTIVTGVMLPPGTDNARIIKTIDGLASNNTHPSTITSQPATISTTTSIPITTISTTVSIPTTTISTTTTSIPTKGTNISTTISSVTTTIPPTSSIAATDFASGAVWIGFMTYTDGLSKITENISLLFLSDGSWIGAQTVAKEYYDENYNLKGRYTVTSATTLKGTGTSKAQTSATWAKEHIVFDCQLAEKYMSCNMDQGSGSSSAIKIFVTTSTSSVKPTTTMTITTSSIVATGSFDPVGGWKYVYSYNHGSRKQYLYTELIKIIFLADSKWKAAIIISNYNIEQASGIDKVYQLKGNYTVTSAMTLKGTGNIKEEASTTWDSSENIVFNCKLVSMNLSCDMEDGTGVTNTILFIKQLDSQSDVP